MIPETTAVRIRPVEWVKLLALVLVSNPIFTWLWYELYFRTLHGGLLSTQTYVMDTVPVLVLGVHSILVFWQLRKFNTWPRQRQLVLVFATLFLLLFTFFAGHMAGTHMGWRGVQQEVESLP
jgi:hypothetical protein